MFLSEFSVSTTRGLLVLCVWKPGASPREQAPSALIATAHQLYTANMRSLGENPFLRKSQCF